MNGSSDGTEGAPAADRASPARTRSDLAIAGGVILVALAARLTFLLLGGDAHWPHSIYYEGDAPVWARWAESLGHGTEFERGLPLRSPGVAYVLHGLGSILGERRYVAFKVVWCVVSAATCGLLYLATLPLGRRTALIAALLLAFSFGAYVTACSLNAEALYTFLIVPLVMATVRLVRRPSAWLAGASGVLHGAATMLRPEHTLFALIATAYLAAGRSRSAAAASPVGGARGGKGFARSRGVREGAFGPRSAALVMLAAFVASCLPWSVHVSRSLRAFNDRMTGPIDAKPGQPVWTDAARAYLEALPPFVRSDNFEYISFLAQQAGAREVTLDAVRRYFEVEMGYIPQRLPRWVFVSPVGPLNFALANHPGAGGGFSKAALDARLGPDPPLSLALPTHLKLVNHGYAVGWEFILGDPGTWLANVGRKLAHFSDGLAMGVGALNAPLGREGVRRAVDILAADRSGGFLLWKGLVLALMAVGAGLALRGRNDAIARVWLWVVAYKVLVAILFFGYARQAVSIAPAAYVLAAMACDAGLRRLDRFVWLRRAGWMALLVGGAVMVAVDVWVARTPAALRVVGPAQLAPHWAENAFEAHQTIELRMVAGP